MNPIHNVFHTQGPQGDVPVWNPVGMGQKTSDPPTDQSRWGKSPNGLFQLVRSEDVNHCAVICCHWTRSWTTQDGWGRYHQTYSVRVRRCYPPTVCVRFGPTPISAIDIRPLLAISVLYTFYWHIELFNFWWNPYWYFVDSHLHVKFLCMSIPVAFDSYCSWWIWLTSLVDDDPDFDWW